MLIVSKNYIFVQLLDNKVFKQHIMFTSVDRYGRHSLLEIST